MALMGRVLADRAAPGERAAFLRGLTARGEYARAYLAWVGFLRPAQAAAVRPVYDGDFREGDAPAPFNWTLRDDAAALAERVRDPRLRGGTALAVAVRGAQPVVIAAETLLLPPGRHAFYVVADAGGGGGGGVFRWDLTCRPSGAVLPLAGLVAHPARTVRLAAAVTLPPAGCAAQELVLHGDPGDGGGETRAAFAGLAIERR